MPRRDVPNKFDGRYPTEEYQRCRYYPACEIHLGRMPERRRTQAEVGPGERADILTLYGKGVDRSVIADRHRLTYWSVRRITIGDQPRSNRWETG